MLFRSILQDGSEPIETQVENKLAYKKIEKVILTKLNQREREIIIKRYGLCGEIPRTQIELAEEMDISRSYISRLEKKALNMLKTTFFAEN